MMGRHSDVMGAKPESDESKQRLVDELKRRGNLAFKAVGFSSFFFFFEIASFLRVDVSTEIDGGSTCVVFKSN